MNRTWASSSLSGHCTSEEILETFVKFGVRCKFIPCIILCSVALVTNVYFLLLTCRAYAYNRLPKKRHILIISTCLADIAQLTGASYKTYLSYAAPPVNPDHYTICVITMTLPFVVMAATSFNYLAQSMFQLIAVRWPFFYKITITKRDTVLVAVGCWAVALPMMGLLSYGLLHVGEPVFLVVQALMMSVFFAVYVAVNSAYVATVLTIFRPKSPQEKTQSSRGPSGRRASAEKYRKHRQNVIILGVQIGAFVLSFMAIMANFIYQIVVVYPLIKTTDCHLSISEFEEKFSPVLTLTTMGFMIWFSRTLVDPTLHMIAEPDIYFHPLTPHKGKLRLGNRGRGTTTSMVESDQLIPPASSFVSSSPTPSFVECSPRL